MKNVNLSLISETARKHPIIVILLITGLIVLLTLRVSMDGINNSTVEATVGYQLPTTLIAIITLILSFLGVYYSRKQSSAAERSNSIAQKSQITEFIEHYSRAIDQLGSEKIEIRLGAISALEIIANKSDEYYWQIMEILTAYIRENSYIKKDIDIDSVEYLNELHEDTKVKADIQAILTVIRRRKYFFESGDSDRLDLHRTNLKEADLHGANLQGADLRGTNLQGADLRDTDFSNTDLIIGKEADFQGADLQGANLRMANLQGANLIKANFQGAYLFGTNFLGADLIEANFQGADLMAAYFRGADLMAANFQGADLRGANFQGARYLLLGQLSTVRTLKDTKFDEEILALLKENYPDLLEAPSELEQLSNDLKKYKE